MFAKVKHVAIVSENYTPRLPPSPLGTEPKGAALEGLFCRSCSLSHYHFADTDGVLIDATE